MRPTVCALCCASLLLSCSGILDEGPGPVVLIDGAIGSKDGRQPAVDSYLPMDQRQQNDEPTRYGCLTQAEYEASLVADFADRDALPQSPAPKPWKCLSVCQSGTSSSCYEVCQPPVFNAELPTVYAKPSVPACVDALEWKRDRVIAAAKKWIGNTKYLPCSRIPACGGVDCSAFTSWVYNYGLGIKFIVGGVADQLDDPVAGTTRIDRSGGIDEFVKKLKKGDLLFFKNVGSWQHTGIYIDGYDFIHSNPTPDNGVQLDTLAPSSSNWYEPRLAAAKRVIE